MALDIEGLGKRLYIFRKEIGISQRFLSEKTGIERTFITRVENGMTPSFDFLMKLVKTFDLSIDWLISGDGQKFARDNSKLQNIDDEKLMVLLYKIIEMPNDKKEKYITIFNDLLDQ